MVDAATERVTTIGTWITLDYLHVIQGLLTDGLSQTATLMRGKAVAATDLKNIL